MLSVSATVLPGWTVSADNATSTSILIQWTNLTSLLKRQVHHYIIFLNKTEGDSLAYAITDGKRLNTEIDGLQHSTTYIVQVFGVDELRRSYRALEVVAETEQRKGYSCYCCLVVNLFVAVFAH